MYKLLFPFVMFAIVASIYAFVPSASQSLHVCGNVSESEMMSEFNESPKANYLIPPTIEGTPIKYCAIHCTGNMIDEHGTYSDLEWWKRARGWSRVGYHAVVYRDGTLEITKDDFVLDDIQEPDEYTYGIAGINRETIHYAYVGGVDENGSPAANMTDAQFHTLNGLIAATISAVPNIRVGGHRDFIKMMNKKYKDCPSMDATFEFCDVVGWRRL